MESVRWQAARLNRRRPYHRMIRQLTAIRWPLGCTICGIQISLIKEEPMRHVNRSQWGSFNTLPRQFLLADTHSCENAPCGGTSNVCGSSGFVLALEDSFWHYHLSLQRIPHPHHFKPLPRNRYKISPLLGWVEYIPLFCFLIYLS